MMIESAREFVEKEIRPNLDAIDNQQEGLVVSLLDKPENLDCLALRFRKNMVE